MDEAETQPLIRIVAGGAAGWLAASRIAAAADLVADPPVPVTPIGSPDVATIGIGECHAMLACEASFRQGSRPGGWATARADDAYLHPSAPLADAAVRDLVAATPGHGADATRYRGTPAARAT